MALRQGYVSTPPSGLLDNGHVSSGLGAYSVGYWPPPPMQSLESPGVGTRTQQRMTTITRAMRGAVARSFYDDFYFRIHITPSTIDLGNLVTAQTRSIDIWNAWPDTTQSLTTLDMASAEGITLAGDGSLPLSFAPLQQRTWSVAVSTEGPPVIDATLTWLFAGLQPQAVTITGNRLTAWSIPPHWANGVLERLEWLSEVQRSADGSEDAYTLRDTPRRTWEFDVRVGNAHRGLLEAALYDWSARNWAFPVSPDHSLLAAALPPAQSTIPLATANLDFAVGALVMLWSSPTQFEMIEVASIGADALVLARPTVSAWPAGTRVYPVRVARLTARPQLQHATSRRLDAHVSMEAVEACEWPAVAPATTYAGYPVLEHVTEASNAPTAVFERDLDLLDPDIGPVSVDDITGLAWPRQSHAWTLAGRAARAALRSLMYYCEGRVNRLWVPTRMDDLVPVATVTAAALAIDVTWCGYTRYLHGQPGRKHLRIELVDGTVFYRAITGWSELDVATERLSIDTALGRDVAPADVAQVCYMGLCHLAGDTVEIQHDTDSEGVAHCSVQFAGASGNE